MAAIDELRPVVEAAIGRLTDGKTVLENEQKAHAETKAQLATTQAQLAASEAGILDLKNKIVSANV